RGRDVGYAEGDGGQSMQCHGWYLSVIPSRLPRHSLREAVLHLATVVPGVQMHGRSVDRPLGAETDQHAILAAGHLLDERTRRRRQRLPRHDLTDPDHGV